MLGLTNAEQCNNEATLLQAWSAHRPKSIQVDARMSRGDISLYSRPVTFPAGEESHQALGSTRHRFCDRY